METRERILERIAKLLAGMEEEAIPQIVQMVEAFAQQHQKKQGLRLVVIGA